MEQIKALNALEPFLALSKSATSPRAAASLIVRATSAPNAFIFTELLQTPQIQALASSSDEYAPYLTLLQIFSYGTYTSLTDGTAAHALPTLNDAQKLKLRQLSLLTLARDSNPTSSNTTVVSSSRSTLSYPSLLSLLNLPSPRELEELVISAIYAGLIHAQLDPKNELVRVNSVAALRDVAPSSEDGNNAIGGLLSSLQAWADRCEATLQSLEAQMSGLRADADRRAAHAAAWSNKMDKLVEDEQRGGASSGLPSVGGGNGNGGFGGTYDHHGGKTMLTVGTGSSNFASAGGGLGSGFGGFGHGGRSASASAAASASGASAATGAGLSKTQRYGKRRSGHIDEPGDGDVEDEAMDVDDDEDSPEGKKRASRRKLQG